MTSADLVVVGGGPAGTASAITAARAGRSVVLLERGRFPRHKVCGEFISSEAAGLLQQLLAGTQFEHLLEAAPRIGSARLWFAEKPLGFRIAPPALSIPRFELDHALWQAATRAGADCRAEVIASEVRRGSGGLEIAVTGNASIGARSVIDASGRWSNLTQPLLPAVVPKWIGLKRHFRESATTPVVDLYFFQGGYCGVQPIGGVAITVCAMVRSDVARTLEQVLAAAPELWRRSRDWEPASDAVSTAPLAFQSPVPVGDDGVLHAGDAAGFIDPFVGDGIAIALHSGAAAAECAFRSDASLVYASWYKRNVLPAFRAASRFRRLVELPPVVRTPALALLRAQALSGWMVRTTRSRGRV